MWNILTRSTSDKTCRFCRSGPPIAPPPFSLWFIFYCRAPRGCSTQPPTYPLPSNFSKNGKCTPLIKHSQNKERGFRGNWWLDRWFPLPDCALRRMMTHAARAEWPSGDANAPFLLNAMGWCTVHNAYNRHKSIVLMVTDFSPPKYCGLHSNTADCIEVKWASTSSNEHSVLAKYVMQWSPL